MSLVRAFLERVKKELTVPEVKKESELIEKSATTQTQTTVSDPIDCPVGYTVYISHDGKIVFDVFGKRQTLVELLGLHEVAAVKLSLHKDNQLFAGTRFVHEVGLGVAALNAKLEALLSKKDSSEN